MILMAMKDFDFLMPQIRMLKKQGYEVVMANSQKEAENIIEKTKPELAMFDLQLENADSGFVLGYKLKKKYARVPVIICSASSVSTGIPFGPVTGETKIWVKADYFIEKDTNRDVFLKTINNLLELD
jgi:two-component system, OmpR family, response regulator